MPVLADTFSPQSPGPALDAGAAAINDIGGGPPGDARADRRARLRLRAHAHRGAAAGRPRGRRTTTTSSRTSASGSPPAIERALAARRRPPSRSRSTRASTSTSTPTTTSRSCAGSASCARSDARCSSPCRERTSSARSLAGSWEARLDPGERRECGHPAAAALAVADGAEILRLHDASALDAMRVAAAIGGGLRLTAASPTLRRWPGSGCSRRARCDDRLVADQRRGAAARPASVAVPAPLAPRSRRRWRGAGIEALYSHQVEALEAAAAGDVDRHQRHRVGEVAVVQPARARRDRRATRRRAPSTSTRPRRSPRTRRASCPSSASASFATRSTTATRPRDDRPAIRRRSNLVLTNPDMLNMASSPITRGGATSSPTCAGSSSTRRTRTAASSAPTSPTCCAGCAGSRALYGSDPRFICASATIANPVELAERADRHRASRSSTPTARRARSGGSRSGTRR